MEPGDNQAFETNPWHRQRVADSCEEAWEMVIEKSCNELKQIFELLEMV